MARLSKKRLLDIIVDSLERSGCAITATSSGDEHPFRFEIESGSSSVKVRTYIWNTTHGGASRSVDEFRIQITSGIQAFEREPHGVTLILGWSETYKVFAGFDIAYHDGSLGSSPSIQIGEATMALAATRGFAAQQKSNREIAVAVRRDKLADYVLAHTAVHAGNVDLSDKPDLGHAPPSEGIDFELLEVEAAAVNIATLWRKNPVWMHPQIKLDHRPAAAAPPNCDHLTAVIGRNGTGKSHLLSAIVDTFIGLELVATRRRNRLRAMPLARLRYRIGEKICELIRKPNGDCDVTVNGTPIELGDAPLPQRVVALTITPFDKFHVPELSRSSSGEEQPSRYRYLGLRDRTNKASIENLLFRSLNSLFERSSNPAVKRARIGRVFEFLDLVPKITVVYRVRISKDVSAVAAAGKSILAPGVIKNRAIFHRASELVKSEEFSEDEIANAINQVGARSQNGFIRLTADFGDGGQLDNLFAAFQGLRRSGFLQLRAVEVEQNGGLVTDLKRASSGQLGMATALLSLASEIQDGSLVLIDEPEISLHPEWQVKYIGLLLETFEAYEGCHFIIATHSPLVISELPPHATLIALDNPDSPPAPALAGQSADVLLAEAFQMISNGNLHIRDLLVQALRDAADGKAATQEFRDSVDHLSKLTKDLPPESGIRTVVEGLSEAATDALSDAE
ncbi:ATP-binding protein [Sphingomonas sp. R647]|uniref:ATP-binding protein n=1 Tax=Sphingomonas sp. R647 TaxID=2875233 RepID=UPI001CD4C7D7|nr:ATP-binding protein [Sphingomonas sp. R647]MCA1197854.1 ATP-binding protein [Sphingomonas sp. R647]